MPGTTRGHVGFGKVGTTYALTGQSVTAPGMSSGDEHNFGLAYGVGAGFNLTANVQLVGEWEQHRLDFLSGRENVSMYSLGLCYKF